MSDKRIGGRAGIRTLGVLIANDVHSKLSPGVAIYSTSERGR
jgi:hypothetical protein